MNNGGEVKWKKAIDSMLANADASKRHSIVMIGTTAKHNNPPLVIAPSRESDLFVSSSFIIHNSKQLLEICKYADGKADYVFIDAESKTPESVSFVTLAASVVKQSKIKTFKGNDITVLSCDLLISNLITDLSNKKAVIIGAGNIGSKVALVLAERGAQVYICRRDAKAQLLSDALNDIKNKYTRGKIIAANSVLEASKGADIIIGFTQGFSVITKEIIKELAPNALIIDGGIGTIEAEAVSEANAAGFLLYRLDVRIAFPYVINSILFTEHFIQHTSGRIAKNGQHYVAGGIIGFKGDIVVDSIQNPSIIIGIADGRGGVSSNICLEDKEKD